jgi:hypothetical protein
LFTQYDEDLGDRLNLGRPADDFETYRGLVTKSIAGVVGANETADDPTGRNERSWLFKHGSWLNELRVGLWAA